MMKIVVCIKQIRHVYARTGMDPERQFLEARDHVTCLNPYDEAAVEMALCTREIRGTGEVALLTLGPLIAEKELRRCLAMGADHLWRIDAGGWMDPWRKAGLLAGAIRALEADLVLCGRESLDRQSGQVGAFMAHHLEIPFVSDVTDLKMISRDGAEVLRKAGRGVRERVACPLPAVLGVDMVIHEPRIPPYEKMRRAWSVPIQVLHAEGEGPKNKTTLLRRIPPRPRPKEVPVPDSRLEAFERIDLLLKGSRIEKRGAVLTGTPQSQAEGILSFLRENGFLKGSKK